MATTESTPRENAQINTWVALLGCKDEPTDGVEDYCVFLGRALEKRGVRLERARVSWREQGWLRSLRELWRETKGWRGRWVLLQYTSLGWSRRGFPFGAVAVLAVFWQRGVRCAVVFHDAHGFYGYRAVDRFRRFCQHWTMGRAYRLAQRSIFTIPFENIGWLPKFPTKAAFIPIGANIPEVKIWREESCPGTSQPKTIAVFGVTGGDEIAREVRDIAYAIQYVSEKHSQVRLLVIGRNSKEADASLRSALPGAGVVINTLGVVPAEELARRISDADVLLFVRGCIAGTRGSLIAGIACGLPIVGYSGPETKFPITQAGLQLAPYGDQDALAIALEEVLSNDRLRRDLRSRSLRAYANHFSWEKIAERFTAELTHA